MTTTIGRPVFIRTPFLIGTGLAVLWLLLGFLSDGTTYHLAPLLVAAIPASLYVLESAEPVLARALGLVVTGTVAALVVIGILSAAGRLTGPSLLPFGGAVTESLVVAGSGALIAVAVGIVGSRSR